MISTGQQRYMLLSNVTTGISPYIPGANFNDLTFYFVGTGTISGGTVVIEEADWDVLNSGTMPGGAWGQVTTVPPAGFSAGATQAVHLQRGAYGAVRVNITSPLTGGGTVTVTARGQD